jgi:TPR repeat protein
MSNPCCLTYRRLILAILLMASSSCAAFAGFDDGVGAFERKDYEAALREFRAAAQTGDAGADYYLGRMYLMAEGVAADYKQAVRYFRRAAAQGNANAQFYLGVLYYLGEGASRDYSEAVKWYAAAAAQGDPVAQYYLGVMYASGEGVRTDHVTALMWLDLAAAGGNETAVKFRKLIARTMTPDEISEAGRQTRERMATSRKPKSGR